jgi:mannose-6-phosphate isomerase-like protein (cupin superfamily)
VTDALVKVLDADLGPELAIVEGEGRAHAIIWPGMGAQMRSMHRISLGGGAATTELRHPGEAVYYVIEGAGEATDPSSEDSQAIELGSMVHVEPETAYVIRAGSDGLELVGGPSPPDPALYADVEAS